MSESELADQQKAGKQKTLRLVVMADAVICLLAGLGVGAAALVGPIAVWLGISDFRFGFGMLQFVNAWALWIAIGTAVIAVGIIAMSLVLKVEGGIKLSGLAFIGALSAGAAYIIPETFRPPEGTPAIHDIATDPYRPLEFVAVAPLRADAPNPVEYGVMEGMTVRQHIDLQLEAYPDIKPLQFDSSVEDVFNRSMDAIDQLGWEVVFADVNEGRIEATDTTFWFRFKDDIVIEITTDRVNTILQARSKSRVGRSDVGKNAARLRGFFSLIQS